MFTNNVSFGMFQTNEKINKLRIKKLQSFINQLAKIIRTKKSYKIT